MLSLFLFVREIVPRVGSAYGTSQSSTLGSSIPVLGAKLPLHPSNLGQHSHTSRHRSRQSFTRLHYLPQNSPFPLILQFEGIASLAALLFMTTVPTIFPPSSRLSIGIMHYETKLQNMLQFTSLIAFKHGPQATGVFAQSSRSLPA